MDNEKFIYNEKVQNLESFVGGLDYIEIISQSILQTVNQIKNIEEEEKYLRLKREELELKYNELILKQGEVNVDINA